MKKSHKALIVLVLTGLVILGIAGLAARRPPSDGIYYLPAEVISSQEGATLFGQVDGREPSDDVYSFSGTYPDDVPYLLSMDSLGTEDPADDEILVVWLPAAADPSDPAQPQPSSGS